MFRSRDIWRNGLADRLGASVTILLFAVLSGRAFQVRELQDTVGGALRCVMSIRPTPVALLSPHHPACMQYDWEGEVPLSHGFRSDFIDWRYTGWDSGVNSTVVMDYIGRGDTPAGQEFRSFFRDQVRGSTAVYYAIPLICDAIRKSESCPVSI